MGRFVYSMASIKLSPLKVVTIEEGGTGATTRATARANLGVISRAEKGAPNGVTMLDSDGKIPLSVFGDSYAKLGADGATLPNLLVSGIADSYILLDEFGRLPSGINIGTLATISGIGTLFTNTPSNYVITNFDLMVNYVVTGILGTVTRVDDQIVYTPGNTPGVGGIVVNGRTIPVSLIAPYVTTPTLTNPADGTTFQVRTATVTSNAFATAGASDTHLSSSWEMATDAAFTNIVLTNYDSTTEKLSWAISGLITDTTYYVRVRYKGATLGYSVWSAAIRFNVVIPKINKPAITAPSAGAISNNSTVSITSSAFSVYGGTDTHLNSSWQLALDAAFTNIVQSNYDSATDKTSWAVSGLATNTTYYVRVTHKGTLLGNSEWSNPISFTVKLPFVNQATIASPAAGATGLTASVPVTSSAFTVTNGSDTHQSSSWQLATDSGFSNIVSQAADSTTALTSWSVSGLVGNTAYYLRVRHKGAALGYGAWSPASKFTTGVILVPVLNTPAITAPASGQQGLTINPTLTASPFSVTDGSDTHVSSSWQIATDAAFTNIVLATYDDTVNKTAWYATPLSYNTTYYCRVRYKGASLGYGNWSAVSNFKTLLPYVATPTMTGPANGSVINTRTVTLSSNAFAVVNGSDTHASSSWQIALDSGFTNIILEIYDSPADKLSWSITDLGNNTTFYARVIHKGATFGYSAWSNAIAFSTLLPGVLAPTITSPVNGAIDQFQHLTVTTSAFVATGVADTHFQTDWEVSRSPTFEYVDFNFYYDSINKTSFTVNLYSEDTTYYVRARHRGMNNGWSAWSAASQFTMLTHYYPRAESQKLLVNTTPGNTTDGYDNFGMAVATNETGSIVAIGAPSRKNGSGLATGAIYIYEKTGSTWSLVQSVFPSNGRDADHFGYKISMSASGNTIITSCYYRYGGNGIGIILERSGATWVEQAVIGPSGRALYVTDYSLTLADFFGSALSISADGNTAVVGGDFRHNASNIQHGAAWVFTRSGGVWTQQAEMMPTIADTVDTRFGWCVAISGDGNTIAVGASLGCRMYVFTRSGSTWPQTGSFMAADNPYVGDSFAYSVSLSGDGKRMAVGAYLKPTNTIASGAAYVYHLENGFWTNYSKLVSPIPNNNDFFGYAVSISRNGDTVAVGAFGIGVNYTFQGTAYMYRWIGVWERKVQLTASDAAASAYLGSSIAMDGYGNIAVIGSYGANNSTGTAYLFT